MEFNAPLLRRMVKVLVSPASTIIGLVKFAVPVHALAPSIVTVVPTAAPASWIPTIKVAPGLGAAQVAVRLFTNTVLPTSAVTVKEIGALPSPSPAAVPSTVPNEVYHVMEQPHI